MNYQQIYDEDLNGAYLFYGSEQLLMDRVINYLINKYTSENFRSFNFQILDGRSVDIKTLISTVETLPIFDNKKIVVVRNFAETLKSLQDDFIELAKNLSETTILIFLDYENEVLKTTKFYKYFSKNNRNIEFAKLKENEFRQFLNEYISEKNLRISPANISYLAQKSGYNSRNLSVVLYDIKNELDKIISIAKGEINKDLIDNAYTLSLDTNIFNFLDAISNKNISRAMTELDNLYQMGEAIQKIFYMVSRQFKLLISYSILKEQGLSDMKIMSDIGIKQFEYSKIKASSKIYSKDSLKKIYELLLEYDHFIKTRTIDERSLFESLLVEITSI